MKIHNFSGGYENWLNFCDIFSKIIHENPDLSNTEIIQYLNTYVVEEASKLIQHLATVGTNYETAFDLLHKRYQNTRLMITKLLDKLPDQPSVLGENASKLKKLHDIQECLEFINNLGVNTEGWGPLVVPIVENVESGTLRPTNCSTKSSNPVCNAKTSGSNAIS